MLTRLGWRWLLAVSSIPLLCLALLYPILPESPYWLAATGRTQEALTALQNVARINNTAMPAGTLRHSLSPQVATVDTIALLSKFFSKLCHACR